MSLPRSLLLPRLPLAIQPGASLLSIPTSSLCDVYPTAPTPRARHVWGFVLVLAYLREYLGGTSTDLKLWIPNTHPQLVLTVKYRADVATTSSKKTVQPVLEAPASFCSVDRQQHPTDDMFFNNTVA